MSEKKITILAFVGAVGALITAIGLSTLFIRFAIETYTIAKVQIPPPKLSLWIYTLMAGAIIGGGVGSKKWWVRFLSVVVIFGAPLWLWIAPLSPTNTTILLGGATGGAIALTVLGLFLHFEQPSPKAWDSPTSL